MVEIEGLHEKEFVVTIRWVIDADVLLYEELENMLDQLRETGAAEIEKLELRDKIK